MSDSSSEGLQFVIEALKRQGISLPPERRADVAQTASKLTATGRLLEERLTLANDVHGFMTALRQRATS